MAVLERSELEASPLADLHAIADQLGLDGFRRLRKPDLIDAILGDSEQQGDRPDAAEPAAEPRRDPERGEGRGGRRAGRSARPRARRASARGGGRDRSVSGQTNDVDRPRQLPGRGFRRFLDGSHSPLR